MWQGNTQSYFLQDHVTVVMRCPAKVTQDVVRVDGTDAPLRDTGPGWDLEVQGGSKVIEGNPDRTSIVEGPTYHGKQPESVRNERVVNTNALRRDSRPGGHMGELVTSKGVKGDWRRRNDVKGGGYNGKGCRMDGAANGAHRDLKRVETDALAIEKEGQHELRKRTTSDVPRPSTPLLSHPRRPMEPVDPPHHRGRIKSPPRKIRRKSTYRTIQPGGGQSGRIGGIGYVAYIVQMLGEHPTATTEQRDPPGRSGWSTCSRDSRSHSRGVTFHIRKALERCTHRTASTFHLFIYSHWNKRGTHLFIFYLHFP